MQEGSMRSSAVSHLSSVTRDLTPTHHAPSPCLQSDPHSDGHHNDSSLGIAFPAQHHTGAHLPSLLTSHSFNNSDDRLISLLFSSSSFPSPSFPLLPRFPLDLALAYPIRTKGLLLRHWLLVSLP